MKGLILIRLVTTMPGHKCDCLVIQYIPGSLAYDSVQFSLNYDLVGICMCVCYKSMILSCERLNISWRGLKRVRLARSGDQ